VGHDQEPLAIPGFIFEDENEENERDERKSSANVQKIDVKSACLPALHHKSEALGTLHHPTPGIAAAASHRRITASSHPTANIPS
jgi:hypothetical protein